MAQNNENLFEIIQKYIDENPEEVERDGIDSIMQKLITEHNEKVRGNVIPFSAKANNRKTALDYLDMAEDAMNDKEALKYVQKALKLEPEHMRALEMEFYLKNKYDNPLDYLKGIDKIINKIEIILDKNGFMDEEYKGEFWDVWETRPYMRLLYDKLRTLIECEMYTVAIELAKKMLILSEGDNLGVRYMLMHLYVHMENEEKAKQLYKEFNEKGYFQVGFELPMSVLYYKLQDFTKFRRKAPCFSYGDIRRLLFC